MVYVFLLIVLCFAIAVVLHMHCLFQLPCVQDLTSKQGLCAHLNDNPRDKGIRLDTLALVAIWKRPWIELFNFH